MLYKRLFQYSDILLLSFAARIAGGFRFSALTFAVLLRNSSLYMRDRTPMLPDAKPLQLCCSAVARS
jgi:hypothetical protein